MEHVAGNVCENLKATQDRHKAYVDKKITYGEF